MKQFRIAQDAHSVVVKLRRSGLLALSELTPHSCMPTLAKRLVLVLQ
jgi:hypothetical protein